MSLPADTDDRPWEKPGAVRRDGAPHRGGLLLALGVSSLLVGGASVCFVGLVAFSVPAALAALGLGWPAWGMARRDLRAMGTNAIDPTGRGLTRDGLVCGRAGVVLGLIDLLVAVALLWAEPTRILDP
jgi:hypothetical protein